MIDIEYCYLDDAIGVRFHPEMYNSKDDKIGEFNYQDPDAKSEKLYIDLCELWNSAAKLSTDEPNFIFSVHSRYNLLDNYGRRYSSDFIGPSRAWAKYIGICDEKIGAYLKDARTIGGHMIWPLNGTSRTINTARGGGNSLYDRFDLTLAELRSYFENGDVLFSRGLRNVFEKEKEWLSLFCNSPQNGLAAFKSFIDYWELNCFVTGDDYRVISLANSDIESEKIVCVEQSEAIFPGNNKGLSYKQLIQINTFEDTQYRTELQESYVNFIDNSIELINRRNNKLESICEEIRV